MNLRGAPVEFKRHGDAVPFELRDRDILAAPLANEVAIHLSHSLLVGDLAILFAAARDGGLHRGRGATL